MTQTTGQNAAEPYIDSNNTDDKPGKILINLWWTKKKLFQQDTSAPRKMLYWKQEKHKACKEKCWRSKKEEIEEKEQRKYVQLSLTLLNSLPRNATSSEL